MGPTQSAEALRARTEFLKKEFCIKSVRYKPYLSFQPVDGSYLTQSAEALGTRTEFLKKEFCIKSVGYKPYLSFQPVDLRM